MASIDHSTSHKNVETTAEAASGTIQRPCSEFAATPDAVIVHDPVESGALRRMIQASDAELGEWYLFRDRPDLCEYAAHHRQFVDTVGRNVAQIHYLADLLAAAPEYKAAHVNPNQVYTRDALITLPTAPGQYIPGRMFSPIRRPEAQTMRAAALGLGLTPLTEIPDGLVLEGGDVIPYARGERRSLLVGYGRRTGRETLDFLRDALIPTYLDEIIGVALAPCRINLDGGLVPVASDLVVAQPDSLVDGVLIEASGSSRVNVLDLLRDDGVAVLEVTIDESIYQQACNCLCLGARRIVCYDLCPRLSAQLHQHGVETVLVPGVELVKGRGGPRCMSRPIYGL